MQKGSSSRQVTNYHIIILHVVCTVTHSKITTKKSKSDQIWNNLVLKVFFKEVKYGHIQKPHTRFALKLHTIFTSQGQDTERFIFQMFDALYWAQTSEHKFTVLVCCIPNLSTKYLIIIAYMCTLYKRVHSISKSTNENPKTLLSIIDRPT